MEVQTLNIYSKSEDPRARILSNFSHSPFILNSQHFESVEGYIQGIAFPENDPRRQQAFASWGSEAKNIGKLSSRDYIWWEDRQVIFGSSEEHQYIELALRAKFDQNSEARECLIATQGVALVHEVPDLIPEKTSLPSHIFCTILTRIREEYTR